MKVLPYDPKIQFQHCLSGKEDNPGSFDNIGIYNTSFTYFFSPNCVLNNQFYIKMEQMLCEIIYSCKQNLYQTSFLFGTFSVSKQNSSNESSLFSMDHFYNSSFLYLCKFSCLKNKKKIFQSRVTHCGKIIQGLQNNQRQAMIHHKNRSNKPAFKKKFHQVIKKM